MDEVFLPCSDRNIFIFYLIWIIVPEVNCYCCCGNAFRWKLKTFRTFYFMNDVSYIIVVNQILIFNVISIMKYHK